MISHAFRKLKVHSRNYPINHLDFEVVVFALNILRPYVFRLMYEVFVDHHSLQNVFTQRDLNLI